MTDGRNVVLAVVAVIALGLGVVALVIGLNAKNTSDDSATQAELQKLQRKTLKQGSAQKKQEQGVKHAQREQGKKQAQQEKQVSAQGKHERQQTAEINATSRKVAVLRTQIRHLTGDVDDLKARVNQLAKTKKNK